MTTSPDNPSALQNRPASPPPVRSGNSTGAKRRREREPHIDALIRLVTVRIVRLAELILRTGTLTFKDRFGVKNTDLRILVMLGAYQPISVNEVSRRTHIDKAWISRSLLGLLRRKLVTKTVHPTDSRAALLSLTKAGEELLRQIAPVSIAYQRELLRGFRSRDMERVLETLCDRAEDMLQLATEKNATELAARNRRPAARSRPTGKIRKVRS